MSLGSWSKWCRSYGSAFLVGAALAGCGGGEVADEPLEPSVPEVEVEAQQETALKWSVRSTEEEVARLTKFWAYERLKINGDRFVMTKSRYTYDLEAKAPVDECYNGLGQPSTTPVNGTCGSGQPKRNQAYVWGLTYAEGSAWFGTIANTHCLVQDGFLGQTTPQENPFWVCEFDQRPGGDFRAPHLYRYNQLTSTLELKDPPAGSPADQLRRATIGFRSAGDLNGVVFLAGPAAPQLGGINLFAFDATTGALLGARNFQQYDDIRTWVVAGGGLYAGVQNANITGPTAPGGFVLRWRGSKSVDPNVLFNFEIVGELDTEAANLAEHQGRIFVTTWPHVAPNDIRYFSVWRSPRLGATGLSAGSARQWNKIWNYGDYDPDPIAAAVTGGGDLESFGDTLYWGTMHVPFFATTAALAQHQAGAIDLDANRNGTVDPAEILRTALGSHRSISIFQAFGCDSKKPKVRVLYGERYLPRYEASKRGYTIDYDKFHRSRMGGPAFGSSGFGNFFNAYTWSMQAHRGELLVGTFDWSLLLRVGVEDLIGVVNPGPSVLNSVLPHLGPFLPREGADLFAFTHPLARARAESLTGVGNFTNYGVRTMEPGIGGLFVGSANPMNLHPLGGWELILLEPKYTKK